MVINANTKIGSILKQRSEALEAIISISPKFEKLRNPILRRVMAARTSIATAARIGNCQVTDFFDKLKPLGFEIDSSVVANSREKEQLPAFMIHLQRDQVEELDVRPVLASGKDPLALIIQRTKALQPGRVLKIINSFYPEPLVLLLKKQGFDAFADNVNDNLVETYFYKKGHTPAPDTQLQTEPDENWENVLQQYKEALQVIDVRHLEMPRPMMTILEAIDKLPYDTALYVYHKRIPVYLLPELKERQFSFLVKEISEAEVHLLIYKK